jgi:putative redox protein
VCHAPRDEYVGIDNATQIFTAARHPKSFLSLDTADHLLRKREDAIYLADVIAAWASRYLPAAEKSATCRRHRRGAGDAHGAFGAACVGGRHVLWPVSGRGRRRRRRTGPYDYLLAALGACTSMTMRLYADRKGLAAERFSVRLSIAGSTPGLRRLRTKQGNIGEITRDITIEGDIPESCADTAHGNRRPVPGHETLTHEIKIRSRLVG